MEREPSNCERLVEIDQELRAIAVMRAALEARWEPLVHERIAVVTEISKEK